MKLLEAFGRSALMPLTKSGIGSMVSNRGAWWPLVREPFTGAWQRNEEWRLESVLQYPTVYACVTQIANDIGKLRARLMQLNASDGIWTETTSPAFSPVLRDPNRYQNHIQFKQWWITSKLIHGNAYVLKERDSRGVVVREYVLDPSLVTVSVTPDGDIFYQLNADNVNGIETMVNVPASEIIHDRMNCLFHPLVGVSPLFAAGLAATLGLRIQSDSLKFFSNGAMPGGVLEAPGTISPETAARLKETWSGGFTGDNAGKVAILGEGLKYSPLKMTAVDSQHVQRQEALDKYICAAFKVPPYIIGLAVLPSGMKPGDIKQTYYDECLHVLIEEMEACQDKGLAVPSQYRVELDVEALLRMDQATQVTTLAAAVGGAIMAPNEARLRMNLKPLTGGQTVYLQQQNYSLEALDERDRNDPFAAAPAPTPPPVDPEEEPDETERALSLLRTKSLVTA
jgi:HK97 family phage portal protein